VRGKVANFYDQQLVLSLYRISERYYHLTFKTLSLLDSFWFATTIHLSPVKYFYTKLVKIQKNSAFPTPPSRYYSPFVEMKAIAHVVVYNYANTTN
jgi:hypothetical protein